MGMLPIHAEALLRLGMKEHLMNEPQRPCLGRRRTTALRTIVALVLVSVPFQVFAQFPKVIDITETAPPDFPFDGTAILLGDNQEQPYFFWTDGSTLDAYRVDEAGIFLPVEILPATESKRKVSDLVLSSRSDLANALFFWEYANQVRTLWAIRDSGKGLIPAILKQDVALETTPLPKLWAKVLGPVGWLIFTESEGTLQTMLWTYGGETTSFLPIEGIKGTVTDIQLFESPGLADSQAALVISALENRQSHLYQANLSSEGVADQVIELWSGQGPVFSVTSNDLHWPSDHHTFFWTTPGELHRVQVQGNQLGQRETVSIVESSKVTYENFGKDQEYLLVKPLTGARFKVGRLGTSLGDIQFRQGVSIDDRAPFPVWNNPDGSLIVATSIDLDAEGRVNSIFVDSPDLTLQLGEKKLSLESPLNSWFFLGTLWPPSLLRQESATSAEALYFDQSNGWVGGGSRPVPAGFQNLPVNTGTLYCWGFPQTLVLHSAVHGVSGTSRTAAVVYRGTQEDTAR